MKPAEEYQEIRNLFRNIAKQFQETREQFQETDQRLDKRIKETREQFQETREQFRETREQFQETRKQTQETDRRLDKRIQETDKRIKERSDETDRKIKEVSRQIGALGGKWGRFLEGIILPSVKNLFLSRNLEIDRTFERVKAQKNGRNIEIDILAVNSDFVILIEIKSTLSVNDVSDTIDMLKKFKDFFPEYQERKIFGAVAGLVIENSADKFAYRRGLFVIGQKGDSAILLNDHSFQPKAYGMER